MAELKFHNLDIFINKIALIGNGANDYLRDVLGRCMHEDVWPLWIKQISFSDHTLEDLRKLGHPYSVRKGANTFVHPDDVVHIQDGNLIGGTYIDLDEDGMSWRLVTQTPEYIFLRYGTSTMRMRDPGGAAFAEALPAIRRRFATEVKAAIVKIVAS